MLSGYGLVAGNYEAKLIKYCSTICSVCGFCVFVSISISIVQCTRSHMTSVSNTIRMNYLLNKVRSRRVCIHNTTSPYVHLSPSLPHSHTHTFSIRVCMSSLLSFKHFGYLPCFFVCACVPV